MEGFHDSITNLVECNMFSLVTLISNIRVVVTVDSFKQLENHSKPEKHQLSEVKLNPRF